jgi:hypothetical protein
MYAKEKEEEEEEEEGEAEGEAEEEEFSELCKKDRRINFNLEYNLLSIIGAKVRQRRDRPDLAIMRSIYCIKE